MKIPLFQLYLIFLLLNQAYGQSLIQKYNNLSHQYFNVKDTLYTFSDYIIEVYLPEQKIILHFRNGKTLEFKCSTGDARLEKGVETPEGIFVIKNKARKVYSAQFDSTLMLEWMGFNFNIGFHALEGNSYYRHLGKRVSSHGCIRMSREDMKFLFETISIGTPVFLHSGKSARVVAFADKNYRYKIYSSKKLNSILKNNLKNLYSGLYLNKRIPVVISNLNVTHRGIEPGNEDLIPPQLPPVQPHREFYVNRNLFEVIKE
ncbi:MAG: L,D-transpeptidase [Ignavibacteria bacterium]